jgi:hypothetical protein
MASLLAAGLAASVLIVAVVGPARADQDRRHDRRAYIVPPGHRVRSLPPRYTPIVVNRRPYYYYGGLFYQPYYPSYVVVNAPIGARVGWLPPGYVSFGLGGHNYAYFNATFYLWDPPQRNYIVVEKPAGADQALAAAEAGETSGAELYVYPARGQSADQVQRDRYECHLWAVDQTRFDPSMGDADAVQSGEYRRAVTACLEGRGYTVK